MTPEQIAELREKRYNATVVGLRKPHSDLMIVRIRPDFPIPDHLPGQYVTLGMGYWEPRTAGCQEETLTDEDRAKVVRRAYSISCPMLADELTGLADYGKEWLEFYIVLVRSAEKSPPALTPRLFELKVGDRLMAGTKITGHFTASIVKPDDAVLFLSTGTGEAPHNYMLWDLLRKGHGGPMINACCVRLLADLGYRETHRQLMERFPQYHYLSLATREPGTVKKVYIQDLIQSGQLEEVLGRGLDPERTHVFLCGNPQMIGVPEKHPETGERVYPKTLGVVELLERRGFRCDQPNAKIVGNIHYEEYW